MPGAYSYHNAMNYLDIVPQFVKLDENGKKDRHEIPPRAEIAGKDNRWPTHCGCGYEFMEADHKQVFTRTLYARLDQPEAEPQTWEDMPVGAMRDCWWVDDSHRGADGIGLEVKLPFNYGWMVEGRASNCDRRDDHTHKCWVRHGDPRTGVVHVDKNGHTCGAGAGSIDTGKYHGFLHDGHLTECP